MKFVKEYDKRFPDWIWEELAREVKEVFKNRAVLPVKGKTHIEVTDALSYANENFDSREGFYADKDYDKTTELDIYPMCFIDGYMAAYRVDLIKKTVYCLDSEQKKYSDDIEYDEDELFPWDLSLGYIKKNLTNKIKFLIFSVYDDYGAISYFDRIK